MADLIPSLKHIYVHNDTGESVIVFYASGNEVRYAPATLNKGQEFKSDWLTFLANYERDIEQFDAAAFTSLANTSLEEGTVLVFTLTTDEDPNITFTITGGADAAQFVLVAEVLDFVGGVAPPFNTPLDANANNVYELQVTGTDDDGNATVQVMTVTVTETP